MQINVFRKAGCVDMNKLCAINTNMSFKNLPALENGNYA